MGVSRLLKVSVIVPGHRVEEAVREIYGFEWFHAEGGGEVDERLRDGYERVRRIGVELDALIRELGVEESQGVIDQILRGYRVEKETLEAEELRELVEDLEGRVRPILEEAGRLRRELRNARDTLSELKPLHQALRLLRDTGIDLKALQEFRRFYVTLALVQKRDLEEIRRSLPEAGVSYVDVGEGFAALLIASRREDRFRVERVLHGFGVRPFQIPSQYPQNLQEAYRVVEERLREAEARVAEAEKKLDELRVKYGGKLLSYREAAKILEEIFRRLGASGGFKRFKIISGYIPEEMGEEFRRRFDGKYAVFMEKPGHGGHHGHSDAPTLLNNKGVVKGFEKITEIQGIPSYGEPDPTPIVSIFFSIFYGIMFADLGQGLVIAIFGYIMYRRVSERLKEWAKLLTILGVASAIGGFLLGEAFGFKVGKLIGSPEVLHLVADHEFEMKEVLKLMQFTFFMGIIHLILGYVLGFRKALGHDKVEAFLVKLPTITMYIFGILFALSFLGAGDMAGIMTSENPVPLLGIPVKTLGPIAIGGVVASLLVLVLGRAVAAVIGKIRGTLIGYLGMGLLEVLENIIHFMSNTLSYVRLTVLLLVHVALLMLLNTTWDALGPASIPILIIGNLGIMALEGMMAFIQALRLHLYEFFTKFYEGAGRPFQKIKPDTVRVEIRFRQAT